MTLEVGDFTLCSTSSYALALAVSTVLHRLFSLVPHFIMDWHHLLEEAPHICCGVYKNMSSNFLSLGCRRS
jgi:hypothetical protein